MPDKPELLPCPFCGSSMDSFVPSPEGLARNNSTGALCVACDCSAMGPEGHGIAGAIASWNRRAHDVDALATARREAREEALRDAVRVCLDDAAAEQAMAEAAAPDARDRLVHGYAANGSIVLANRIRALATPPERAPDEETPAPDSEGGER